MTLLSEGFLPAALSAAHRRAWVEAYARTRDAASVCATFGISRPTLRNWCARHDRHGEAGLESASPVPRRSPGRKLLTADRSDFRDWKSERCSLAQMQRRLTERGVSVSIPTIRRTLAGATGVPAPATPGSSAGPSLFDTLFLALADGVTSGSLRPGDKLEKEVLRLLTARISPGEIAQLRQHVRQQADAERRGEGYIRALADRPPPTASHAVRQRLPAQLRPGAGFGHGAPSCAVNNHRA